MVFSYHHVKEHPKLFLAMTGLTHTEFHQFLPHFQYAWEQYVQQYYVDRDNRQRQYGGGRAESTLVNIEDKLLFMVYDVKVYPLQEMLAFAFGALVPLNVQTRIREQFFWTSRLARVMLLLSRTFLSPGGDHDLNPPTLPLL